MNPLNPAEDGSAAGEDGEWIVPRRYLELALSNRRLLRCDQPMRGLIGLQDPSTGRRYWIQRERLWETGVSSQDT